MSTIQSMAASKQIAETQPWFLYGNEMRAVGKSGKGNVLAAPKNGGRVLLYVPGGQVYADVTVGPFSRDRRFPDEAALSPEWTIYSMSEPQRTALTSLCEGYHVEFSETAFRPRFDLPAGYFAGQVGPIFVGCDPEGRISS